MPRRSESVLRVFLKNFDDEAAFLTFLREFYDWETSKGFYPDKAPEFEAWKLILRLLRW